MIARAAQREVLAVHAALALYFAWPLLSTGSALGIADWDAQLFQHAAVFRSVYEYGQLPFWNPWFCGGNVLWQNPQAPLLSPVYVMALGVSIPLAMKLNIALHYFVGLAGMHRLLEREFGIASRAWLLSLAALYAFAGGPTLHLSVGHATFLPYFYLPWLLFFFLSALEGGTLRHASAAGGVMALSVWAGGVYVAVMSGVSLAVLAAAAALLRRDWRPIALLALTAVFAGMFAAPKLLPVLLFSADPGIVDIRYFPPGRDQLSWGILTTSLLEPYQYRRLVMGGMLYGWHEYGNYVGSFGVFLVLAALFQVIATRPFRAENWLGVSLALTTVVLLFVAFGDQGPYAPYSLLRRLPGLADLRVPSRYLLVATLFGAATLAWVLGRAQAVTVFREPLARILAVALVLSTLFVMSRNRDLLFGAFPYSPLRYSFGFLSKPPAPTLDRDTDGFGPDSPMLRAMASGRAVLRCNEPLHLAGDVDASRGPVFSDSATLSRVTFSPNRITFAANVRESPARVFLNQRPLRGWHSTAGAVGIDPATRLAYVTLPPGAAGRYSFYFVPPGLVTGLGLCSLGVALAGLVRRRRV